eukprot:6174655-Pleurochrysis_carterae.AAC.4
MQELSSNQYHLHSANENGLLGKWTWRRMRASAKCQQFPCAAPPVARVQRRLPCLASLWRTAARAQRLLGSSARRSIARCGTGAQRCTDP